MAEIVGIRFKNSGKTYFFDPCGCQLQEGDYAVVETSRGQECGYVAGSNRDVPEDQIIRPLKKVIRPATPGDRRQMEDNRKKEDEAFTICQEKIAKHKLDMKLIEVEYAFDRTKILFYFTSDNRVDFRELVKDLASVFRTRIELRQIGVRDEAKMLGGYGICGRPFCCATFLPDFQPVSIKMAKEQNLSLNPTKISGSCGRLMCCLKYEQDTYDELYKITPKVGNVVETPQGRGTVIENNLLTGNLKVRLDATPDAAPTLFERSQVTRLSPQGQKRDGQKERPERAEKNASKPESPKQPDSAELPEQPKQTEKPSNLDKQERTDRRPPRNRNRHSNKPKDHAGSKDGSNPAPNRQNMKQE